MSSPVVVPLEGPGWSRSLVGGKAASLSALARAGFAVPPGFVITTAAYEQFVDAGRLRPEFDARMHIGEAVDPEPLSRAAADLRALVMATSWPEALATQIRAAYERLAGSSEAVAVRSSATAEDSADASFAGLMDTFLGIRGDHALLDAVKACWASLWTERAMRYRARRPGNDWVGHAVLVQRMVNATSAGVLFTVNPISGSPDEVVINAAWGLGDAVVSGRVAPDVLVLSKRDRRVVQTTVHVKALQSVLSQHGTRDVPVAEPLRQRASIEVGAAGELALLALSIEQHFGCPQDVEWAIEDGRIWILQARPVTSAGGRSAAPAAPIDASVVDLAAADDQWPALDERPATSFDLWTLANVGELWPLPVSPIVASTVPAIIGGAVRHSLRALDSQLLDRIQWAKRWYGRVYYNEGALKHALAEGLGLPATFFDRSRGHREVDHGPAPRFRLLPFLRRLPRLLRVGAQQWTTGKELTAVVADIDARYAEFRRGGVANATDRELWAEVEAWIERMRHALNLQNDMSGYALAHFSFLELIVKRWTGEAHVAHDLVSGLAHIESADIGAALADVARALRGAGLDEVVTGHRPAAALAMVRSDPRGAEAVRQLDRFLEEHGHRCANDAEWLYPRWADAPEEVIDMAAAYLRAADPVDPADMARRQLQRRLDATAAVEAHLGPLRRKAFRLLLVRTQAAVRLRDNGKNTAMKACYPARSTVHRLGSRWAERGWLAAADHIFFLTMPDLTRLVEAEQPDAAGMDLRALVARRQRAYEYWLHQPTHDAIGADGRPLASAAAPIQQSDVMRGIAASTGRAHGRARVIHDPHEAMRLAAGDILVTHATDAGWSAVFPLIGGLVTEIGGQLSHAAILAREYGLPAVVNVTNATSRIRDRDTITIDGADGSVRLNRRSDHAFSAHA